MPQTAFSSFPFPALISIYCFPSPPWVLFKLESLEVGLNAKFQREIEPKVLRKTSRHFLSHKLNQIISFFFFTRSRKLKFLSVRETILCSDLNFVANFFFYGSFCKYLQDLMKRKREIFIIMLSVLDEIIFVFWRVRLNNSRVEIARFLIFKA